MLLSSASRRWSGFLHWLTNEILKHPGSPFSKGVEGTTKGRWETEGGWPW